jgi:thiamine pyrophosphate-dependent acetolactate synthase large subunit-like protein
VDFVKAASAFGVEGEAVSEPAKIREALDRAKRATIEGRPYLLEFIIRRDGIGAASTYYPHFSVADERTRKV